jgi:hypothetical protein
MVLAPLQFSGRSLAPDLLGGIQQGQQVLQGENILQQQQLGIQQTQQRQAQEQQQAQQLAQQQEVARGLAQRSAQGQPIQTGAELAQLFIDNPDLAQTVQDSAGARTEFQKNDLAEFGFQLEQLSGNEQAQQQLIQQRVQNLTDQGRDPSDTAALLQADPNRRAQFARTVQLAALNNEERLEIAGGGRQGLASAKTEFLPGGGSLQALPNGEIVAKDEQNRVVTGQERQDLLDRSKDFQLEIAQGKADIAVRKAGEVAAAQAGVKLETEPEIQARVKQASTEADKKEIREQSSIDRGITAADSTANIRRAVSLLDTVKTGGFDAALVRAKQIFGIEGADEGELSSNLGKAIIAQLRETFGAAFTKSEGDKLDRIEASFTKSPASNRRLLNNTLKLMERLANRGLKAAESREDDFAIQSITDALTFELGDEATNTRRIKLDAQGNIVQ